MKNNKINKNDSLENNIIWAIQCYWIVTLYLKNNVRPRNHFDISAGNIIEIKNNILTIRYKRMIFFNALIKINVSDVIQIKQHFLRKKQLTTEEILDLNKIDSKIRKIQYKKVVFVKWIIILSILIIVSGISIGIAFATK